MSSVGDEGATLGGHAVAVAAGMEEEHSSSLLASTSSLAQAADCCEVAAMAVGVGCEEEGSSVEASASSPPHELSPVATIGIANSTSARRAPVGVFAPPTGEVATLSASEVRQKWKVAT
mmetsp:Transcript_53964/g.101312  ORF Transcript_53964/g.101312 Transcript_53964/m.101312 type:complete len:119 (-) Transcript_53964:313-669(-)